MQYYFRGYHTFDLKILNGHYLKSLNLNVTKHIREYYKGARQSALTLLIASIVLLILAYLVFRDLKQSMAYGLLGGVLVFSAVQIIMSLIGYLRASLKERKLVTAIENVIVLEAEHQRIKKAVPRFPKIRMVQEIFFGLSFLGIFLGLAKVIPPVSLGIAIAVLVQMAIWIANDLFAQRRTEEYERRLRRYIENSSKQ